MLVLLSIMAECKICYNKYDHNDHLPVIFICSHGCCRSCCNKLIQCHLCRASLDDSLYDTRWVNYHLLDVIDDINKHTRYQIIINCSIVSFFYFLYVVSEHIYKNLSQYLCYPCSV